MVFIGFVSFGNRSGSLLGKIIVSDNIYLISSIPGISLKVNVSCSYETIDLRTLTISSVSLSSGIFINTLSSSSSYLSSAT